VRDVAADGAAIPHRGIADQPGGVGQRRRSFDDCRRRRDLRVRRERANADAAAALADAAELSEPADVDKRRRRGQSQLEQRDQAVAAGQQLGAWMFGQQRMRVGERASPVVIEICCVHRYAPFAAGEPALMACQTRSGVSGIVSVLTLKGASASITAL
jgi:hypothetical protein